MNPRELTALKGELRRFKDSLGDIRKTIDRKGFSKESVISNSNKALVRGRFLLHALEEIRLSGDKRGLFLRLRFLGRKRRLVKFVRRARRSLKKSFMLFCADRNARALKWLNFAISNAKDSLRVLDNLNTDSNTAKAVQIQIQKGKSRM